MEKSLLLITYHSLSKILRQDEIHKNT